jgi:hypothetical protein
MSSVGASVGCASRTPELRHTDAVSPEPEVGNDEQYRVGTSAYQRGDWDNARSALLGFVSRKCHPPERAVCRQATLEIARADRKSGHPAAAAITFEALLREASAAERQALTDERDAALAAMRTEWASSPEKVEVQLQYREHASAFQAEEADVFVDGRKVFGTGMPHTNSDVDLVPLAFLLLERGEHILKAQVRFIGNAGKFTVCALGPVQVIDGPVVVELVSDNATRTEMPIETPTLNVVVHQHATPPPHPGFRFESASTPDGGASPP